MPIRLRLSGDRGRADHGWLKSFFTFSFADYSDSLFDGFGCLRVLNDDTVSSGGGFPTHSHSNFEIWSYIMSGALEHRDSLGNIETLGRGSVQFTSAGTGIRHSEFNADKTRDGKGVDVRFLQIWSLPEKRGTTPAYQTGHFSDSEKIDKLCPILLPAASFTPLKGSGPLAINNSLSMHASLISPGVTLSLPITSRHLAYVHCPILPGSSGVSLRCSGDTNAYATTVLHPGDGAFVEGCEGSLLFTGLGSCGLSSSGGISSTNHTEFVVMHFLK